MDWRRTRKAWSVFACRCEDIEQIASTRSFCPSRRRWSDWIQNFGTNVCLTVRAFAPLVIWTMVESFAKRRRFWKESPVLLGSELIRDNPLPSSNSWIFRRKSGWSCIARQRDVTQRFRRVHLPPRWKFPRPALHQPVKIDCWWKRWQRRAGVKPMYAHLRKQWEYDVTKPRVAIYKQTWKIHQNTVYWDNLSPIRPQHLVLKKWWQWIRRKCCTTKYTKLLARRTKSYWDRLGPKYGKILQIRTEENPAPLSGKHRETCCRSDEGNSLPKFDYRNQGLLHSTVKQENYTRNEVVKKLIHQVETHPYRDALKANLKHNQAYNPFTENSKNMIHSMVNVEYFEMCEISSKFSVLSLFDVLGERYRVLHMGNLPASHIQNAKNWAEIEFNALSTPHHVIKKGPLRGARHGDNERQRIYHAAHVATQKIKKERISEMLDLQRVTTRDWVLLRILWGSLKWRSYIFLNCNRTSTTWKQLGTGTEQPRSERSDETTRRQRRSRQNQKSFA